MYASVADMRAEGVTLTMASDDRLVALLAEASALVDRVTGWFFEPHSLTLHLDGRATPSIEPPVPPIRLDEVSINGAPVSLDPRDLFVVGAPVALDFDAPRIAFRRGRVFPHGVGNVVLSGLWGYTEPDGTPTGRTPLAIRRVTMQLALRWLPRLAEADAFAARSQWRIIEERTRDQSYRVSPPAMIGAFVTGDIEIDATLARYRRPFGLGAA